MNKWVSVADRLPDEGDIVLCFEPRKYNQCVTQFIDSKSGFQKEWYEKDGDGFGYHPFITHWMPLPEPPDIEEEK